ncbi:MAG TPA: SMC-Scp complex subunit ScpB [Gemmataceae bacterium]
MAGGPLWQVDGEENLLAGQLPPDEPGPQEPAPRREVTAEPAPPAPPERPELPPSPEQIIEAMLFVGGAPLTAARACEVVRGLTPEQFREVIDGLNRRYRRQRRPYAIRPEGEGQALRVRDRFRALAARLFGSPREARLTQAALDVVALIAYRQPVAKSEIDALRGSDCGPAVRQLVRLGLVTVVHRGEAGQREVSYGTTPRFLEVFGLRSLDDLPRLGEAQRL